MSVRDFTVMTRKYTLLFLSLWIFSLSTFASANQYQIELLVFSHITPAGIQSETWPITAGIPFSADQQNSPVFTPVDTKRYLLQTEATRLSKQNDYRVLYHAAWTVSANDLRTPKTLYITNDPQAPEMNGALHITLTHYFNIHFQLALNESTKNLPTFTTNTISTQLPDTFHFVLDEKRRMRSRELNYIGHPLFGVLIKIIPIPSDQKSV